MIQFLIQVLVNEYMTPLIFRTSFVFLATYLTLEFLYGVDGYLQEEVRKIEESGEG